MPQLASDVRRRFPFRVEPRGPIIVPRTAGIGAFASSADAKANDKVAPKADPRGDTPGSAESGGKTTFVKLIDSGSQQTSTQNRCEPPQKAAIGLHLGTRKGRTY